MYSKILTLKGSPRYIAQVRSQDHNPQSRCLLTQALKHRVLIPLELPVDWISKLASDRSLYRNRLPVEAEAVRTYLLQKLFGSSLQLADSTTQPCVSTNENSYYCNCTIVNIHCIHFRLSIST